MIIYSGLDGSLFLEKGKIYYRDVNGLKTRVEAYKHEGVKGVIITTNKNVRYWTPLYGNEETFVLRLKNSLYDFEIYMPNKEDSKMIMLLIDVENETDSLKTQKLFKEIRKKRVS